MGISRYQMMIVWSDEDDCYLVHLPDFPEPMYHAQGKSYTEAAKNGEDVLQRLDGPATKSLMVAEQSVVPDPTATSEVAIVQVASRSAVQATPPFPVLKTALVGIGTSAVAATMLIALAFISEGFTLPQRATSTTPSAEAPDTSESAQSEASSKLDNNPSIAASPLTLASSIAEANAVWAIATYSDESRNINLIVSGDETGLITIRDQASGQPIRTIAAHDDTVRAIAIAPNARRLISSSGDGIKVWDLQSGDLLYQLPSSASVWSIAIAPDESRFISGANDGTLAAWDLETGQPLYSNSDGKIVWSVAISPDGKSFVSGESDRTLRQWDLATGKPLKTFTGHQSDVRAVAISPDGKTLASGSWDKTIKLWSLETGELKATLEGHQNNVVSLAISSDGKTLASGSTDTTVKLWSLSDYKLLESLEDHSDWVLTTVFKAREKTLITGGKDKEIKIWK